MSDNPFKFPNWLNHDGDGGTKTTDEVLLGQNNRIHSPDDSNPLSDTLTGATIIDVRTPGNAALVGNNGCIIEAGIGVYGHSGTVTAAEEGFNASEPGIGVVGSCDTGLGVVGLALRGDAPSLPPGVGVFGTGDNVGVRGLGGSNGGKGMFGQGGGGTAQGVSPGVVGNAGTNAPNDGVQGFGSGNFSGVAGFGDPKGNGTGVFGTGRGETSTPRPGSRTSLAD